MILCLDIGSKRIGVARLISGVILPLDPIIRSENRLKIADKITELVKNLEIKILVIGKEFDNIAASKTSDFFADLLKNTFNKNNLSIEICFADESFSSAQSESKLLHQKYKTRQKSRKNGTLDSLAACEILERYIKKL
ncbi:MAG: Holliday junction resolvase RuvX [Helicobacter sp.]|nr:Holliday junction resolvase RuvX [Helicobacter sp.]